MAKKKEAKKDIKKEEKIEKVEKVVKEDNKEEETKTTFDIYKEKALKYIKKNKEKVVKYAVSLVILIIVVIVGAVAIKSLNEGSIDNIDYPLVYKRENGQIVLLKSKESKDDGTILSYSDGTGYTTYANKSSRYVLMKKGNDLHLYDVKKDESTKIADDTSIYYFSDDDSYILLLDKDNDMYSYNYKEAKKLLEDGIESIQDYSNNAVLYAKNEALKFVSMDPSKEDRKELVNKFEIAEFSEDGKYVLYTNSNDVLYRYDIKKDKHTKVASDVEAFYCSSKSCDKLYYTSMKDGYAIYYYDGKSEKAIEDLERLLKVDAENQKLLYTKYIDKHEVLYFKKGNSKEQKVADDFLLKGTAKMVEDEIYYTSEKLELKYAKISGSKVGKTKVIDEEIEKELTEMSNGVYYLKNGNDNKEYTLLVAENGKKIKVADDVKETTIKVSNKGNNLYFSKDFGKNISGTFCMFDGEKTITISENVYHFIHIKDGVTYYIKDFDKEKRHGTLYRYTDKSEKIEDLVSELSSTPNVYEIK